MRKPAGAVLALVLSLAAVACKRPMAKIEALRDALVTDEASAVRAAASGYPACADSAATAACLTAIADVIGSKRGFVATPPDHAGASTAAVVLVRDGRGDWLAPSDPWLTSIKTAHGIGSDVLRLAIARKMAEGAPSVGRKIDDDGAARAALLAVVAAIPGACPTYWLVGTGAGASAVPPELSPDHAACVQKDLSRREGPGGSYGSGTFRALEGALALWRETERALRIGLPLAEPGPKAVLEKKLAVIEGATAKIETRKLAPAESTADSALMALMRDLHAEAGVAIVKPDGGADASSSPPSAPIPTRGR